MVSLNCNAKTITDALSLTWGVALVWSLKTYHHMSKLLSSKFFPPNPVTIHRTNDDTTCNIIKISNYFLNYMYTACTCIGDKIRIFTKNIFLKIPLKLFWLMNTTLLESTYHLRTQCRFSVRRRSRPYCGPPICSCCWSSLRTKNLTIQ